MGDIILKHLYPEAADTEVESKLDKNNYDHPRRKFHRERIRGNKKH